jgi:hypothetical protein
MVKGDIDESMACFWDSDTIFEENKGGGGGCTNKVRDSRHNKTRIIK